MVRILDSSEFSTWNEFVRGNSFPESFVQTSLWPAERFFIVGETATSRTDATLTQTNANETIIAGCKVEERGLWMGKKIWLVRRSVNSQQSTVNKIAEYLIGKAKEQGNVVMIRTQLLFPERKLLESKEYTNETLRQAQRVTICSPKFLYRIEDPKVTLLVDLKYSEEELLKEMHEKTRYNIRLAEKKGVEVREGNLEEFYRLYEGTNKRKGLKGFGKEYFEKLLITCHPKLDLGSRKEKQKEKKLSSRVEVSVGINCPAGQFIRSHLGARNEIASEALAMTGGSSGIPVKIFIAYFGSTPLSSNLLVFFGKTVTYLFGGTADKYRELMAPHLLHWECMKWAKANGYSFYDFWGIQDPSSVLSGASPRSPLLRNPLRRGEGKGGDWSGITRFKKGFVSQLTGKEIDFGETQDLVIDSKWYRIFALVKKML